MPVKFLDLRALVVSLLMLMASLTAVAITPSRLMASNDQTFTLEALIPSQFGEWVLDDRAVAVVNPQTEEFLATVYSQTLARTYVNASGRRIMLSIAYGADQSHDNQIHKPEVCYPAQGFQIVERFKDQMRVNGLDLPVMRLETRLSSRNEPVTYWIRVGDRLVRGAIEQNFARISYGMRGAIPDGVLFRVSEINRDPADAFQFQDKFVADLLSSLQPGARAFLIGDELKRVPSASDLRE